MNTRTDYDFFSIGLFLQSIWTFSHYLIPKVGAYAGKLYCLPL